jgi:hypothetical protein
VHQKDRSRLASSFASPEISSSVLPGCRAPASGFQSSQYLFAYKSNNLTVSIAVRFFSSEAQFCGRY